MSFANSQEISGRSKSPFSEKYINTPILAQFILKKEETKIYQGNYKASKYRGLASTDVRHIGGIFRAARDVLMEIMLENG
jgi:hypothetical protein